MEYIDLFEALKTNPSDAYESEILEFKRFKDANALFNSKEFCDEICAFANTYGGRIIIGIIDSKEIKNKNYHDQLFGFEKIDLDVTKERINGKLRPKLDLKMYYIDFEGKSYLTIEISKNRHSLVTTSSGKVYIREGKSSIPAEPYQIQQLVSNLQSYDWSNQEVDVPNPLDLLNNQSIEEAKKDFSSRRNILLTDLEDAVFLESIGATKNGILNYSGLLFLGKKNSIERYLGNYEYRFSWRLNGELKVNDVWNDCIWNSIKRAKRHFSEFNEIIDLEYNNQNYKLTLLDDQAFHEAFLNAIVHRDYSLDGMIAINYKGDELVITNPGLFYGGINEENISYHEPRHRNKNLAKMLMAFQMVDRAGMGVLRISLNSLKYGREFPVWKEISRNIEVRMSSEYIIPAIFVLTQKNIPNCSITDLLIINKLYQAGSINVSELEKDLKKLYKDPWREIEKSLSRDVMKNYIELKGSNNGIFITTTYIGDIWLDVTKKFNAPSNSEKHIKLFRHLKKHKTASNEEIKKLLKFSRPSVTSNFLAKLKYVKNTGKSRSSLWSLK